MPQHRSQPPCAVLTHLLLGFVLAARPHPQRPRSAPSVSEPQIDGGIAALHAGDPGPPIIDGACCHDVWGAGKEVGEIDLPPLIAELRCPSPGDLSGRLGDALGRRRMFLIALSAFVLTSAITGATSTIGLLISARLLQGIAGGMLVPQNSGLIQELFDGDERGKAFGVLGTTVGLATAEVRWSAA